MNISTQSLAPRVLAVLAVIATMAGSSCRTGGSDPGSRILQPGAPGQPSRAITAGEAADLSQVRHTPADVRFMQGMIGHHDQALEMAAMLPSRTSRDDMRLLAKRIEVSQADEIHMMQRWLERRGEEIPSPHPHDAPAATLMPGMLTSEEMARLAAATGAAFERLFLELMIKHHEGALMMVRELFAQPGAGQDAEIFAFASDVEADQRIEIDRMAAMLEELK